MKDILLLVYSKCKYQGQGQNKKNAKCIGQKNLKKTWLSLLTKTESQRLIKIGENPQTAQDTLTEKKTPQFLSAKTKKKNQNLKSAKPKIPRPCSVFICLFFFLHFHSVKLKYIRN